MKYAKQENGKVKKYNVLPNAYENIINKFSESSIEIINAKGFFEVVEPPITEYQRLIQLEVSDFANDKFTHRIYDFNQNDIDAYGQSQLDGDSSAQKLSNYQTDGQLAHKRFWNYVERKHDSGWLSDALYESIATDLWDKVLPVYFGAWKQAKIKVDAIPIPVNVKAQEVLQYVKDKIDNYIAQIY